MKPSPARLAYVAGLKRLLPFPLNSVEKARYRAQVAAVRAQDEARRAGATPQLSMPCEPAGTM
jgi:hypothetical protein